MKSLVRYAPPVLMWAGLMFSSCDLTTLPPSPADLRPANHLVINEVFTLSPDASPNPYTWIEFYNPTSDRIGGLNQWSLTFSHRVVFPPFIDTTLRVTANLDSFFDNIPDTLEAGQFLVLFGDSISFYSHTNLGPGKGRVTIFVPFVVSADSTFYGDVQFQLQDRDELILKDPSGNVVDVVRYGGFVPPSPDPFAGNEAAGPIPQWSSLSRYAGAYSTGSTANDFYIESKPIPMWYSQLNHP